MDLDIQLNQGGGINHVTVDVTNDDTWVTYPDMTVPFGTDYYDGIDAATWQFETAMYETGGVIELYYGSTVIDTYDGYDPDNVTTGYTEQSRSITLPSVASTDIKIRSKYKKYTYDCTDEEETTPPDSYTIYDSTADFSFMGSGTLGHAHFKVYNTSGTYRGYVTEVVNSTTIKCNTAVFGSTHPYDYQIRWGGAQYIGKSSIMIEQRSATKTRIQKYLGKVQYSYESNYVGNGGDCIPGNTWYIDHTAYDENPDPHGHFYYDSDNWEVTSATFKAYLAYDDVNCYAILADPTDDSTVTGSELTVDGTGLYGGAWQSTTVSLSNLTTDTFYCVFGKYSTTGGGSGDYCSVHSPALYFDITSSTDGAYEFGLQVGRRDTYIPTTIQDSEYSDVDSIIFEGHNYVGSYDCELRDASTLTLVKASAKTPTWNSDFFFARNAVTSLADDDYITTDSTPSDNNYDWGEVVFVVITPDDYFAKAHYTKDRTLYDDEIISTTDATAPTVLTNVTGSGVLEELLGDYNGAEIGFYITIDGGVPTAVQTNQLLTTARYNSSLKIETASSGAVITGTVTMSGTGAATATGNVSTP